MGPRGRSGQLLKISPPPGFDSRTVQLVASRYTDYAIPAHGYSYIDVNIQTSDHTPGRDAALAPSNRNNV